MKYTKKELVRNIIMIFVGCAIFSIGFDMFLEPAGFNCGGISGVAMLISYGVDVPWVSIGLLSALMNIPLFFGGYKKIGKYFFFTSLLGAGCISLFIDLFTFLPVPEVEPLLAVAFGGAMSGLGLGIVFMAGASTGGIDIVARLLKSKLPNFPIGKIILCFDLCTAIATGIVFGQVTNTLYSALSLFLSSVVLDRVVYGVDYSKVAIIISDKYDEMSHAIDEGLHRGITFLHGQGFYSGEDKKVMLCAVKRKQMAELKELVDGVDSKAFVILMNAHEVLGDGFKRYDRNDL